MKRKELDKLISEAYELAYEYNRTVDKAELLVTGGKPISKFNVNEVLKAKQTVLNNIAYDATPVHKLLLALGWEWKLRTPPTKLDYTPLKSIMCTGYGSAG